MFKHALDENIWLIFGGICSFFSSDFILSHMPFNIGTLYKIYKNFDEFFLFINSKGKIACAYNTLNNSGVLDKIADVLPYMYVTIACMCVVSISLFYMKDEVDSNIIGFIYRYVTGYILVMSISLLLLFVEIIAVVTLGPMFNSLIEIKNII